jgi:hypothetical protein
MGASRTMLCGLTEQADQNSTTDIAIKAGPKPKLGSWGRGDVSSEILFVPEQRFEFSDNVFQMSFYFFGIVI